VIVEGIVTTLDPEGGLNVAPMGPRVEPDFRRFVLRPFRGSNTYRNLSHRGEGVLHVTDDVLLLARSAVGHVGDAPSRPAEHVRGRVLTDCCRYYEFRVTAVDDREERVSFFSETLRGGWVRDFFGFNRAKHAVIETAILATRVDFLPPDEILSDVARHRLVVEKTGGVREIEALEILEAHIKSAAAIRGGDLDRDRA
jgi:hypothetical protein